MDIRGSGSVNVLASNSHQPHKSQKSSLELEGFSAICYEPTGAHGHSRWRFWRVQVDGSSISSSVIVLPFRRASNMK